jgi:hypothetical protein
MLPLVSGFLAWSVAFVALYGLLSVGCELRWQELPWGPVTLLGGALAATWIAAIAANAWFALSSWRRRYAAREGAHAVTVFMWHLAVAANVAALSSTVWVGLPMLASSLCV